MGGLLSRMKYNKQKIEAGLHELMRMRIGDLEKAVKETSKKITMCTPEFYNALRNYDQANQIASTMINTSEYVTQSTKLLLQGMDDLKKPLDENYINQKLGEMNLNVRAVKTLARMNLLESPIKDLAQKTEIDLLCIKGCGENTFQELRKILTEGGLDFKDYRK